MTFQESIKLCLQKYADFEGRAKRPEYWWFILFLVLVSLALGMVSNLLSALFTLGTIVPSLAVGARRLHDTGRSGWMQLMGLIPLIGWVVLIYFYVQESDAIDNQYDPPPAH